MNPSTAKNSEEMPCAFCKNVVTTLETDCVVCGYPQFGGKFAKLAFIDALNIQKARYEQTIIETQRVLIVFALIGLMCLLVALGLFLMNVNVPLALFDFGFVLLIIIFFGTLYISIPIAAIFGQLKPYFALRALSFPTAFLVFIEFCNWLIMFIYYTENRQFIPIFFVVVCLTSGLAIAGFYQIYRLKSTLAFEEKLNRYPVLRAKVEKTLKKRSSHSDNGHFDRPIF